MLQLAAARDLESLFTRQATLWPPNPDSISALEDWIADAQQLVGQRGEYETTLARLMADGATQRPGVETPLDVPAGDREREWWAGALRSLLDRIDVLDNELLNDGAATPPFGWSIQRRLNFALRLNAAKHRDAGLSAVPTKKLGLQPLGTDPQTGLEEFALLASGSPPTRHDDGTLAMEEPSTIVLVHIPAGTYDMGAQLEDESETNYDPRARPDESPIRRVEVTSFLISKFEVTQGQWRRLGGGSPSFFAAESSTEVSDLHPVEQISWTDARTTLERFGLRLPTEAEWEYAARSGSDFPWIWTAERMDLTSWANVGDPSTKLAGFDWPSAALDLTHPDGAAIHAPIGSYPPNAFGLYDVLGNVWEWCEDGYSPDGYSLLGSSVGPLPPESSPFRVGRGGSFFYPPRFARVSSRGDPVPPGYRYSFLGIRPAMSLD